MTSSDVREADDVLVELVRQLFEISDRIDAGDTEGMDAGDVDRAEQGLRDALDRCLVARHLL